MTTIGERIYELRLSLDMKQKELADKVGITEATLSRYENGKRTPNAEITGRIAKALGVTSDYLLGNEAPKTNENPKKFSPEIETIAAHLDDKNITPKKLKMIQDYIDLLFDDEE